VFLPFFVYWWCRKTCASTLSSALSINPPASASLALPSPCGDARSGRERRLSYTCLLCDTALSLLTRAEAAPGARDQAFLRARFSRKASFSLGRSVPCWALHAPGEEPEAGLPRGTYLLVPPFGGGKHCFCGGSRVQYSEASSQPASGEMIAASRDERDDWRPKVT